MVAEVITNRNHMLLANAELDVTVDPILKVRADAHGQPSFMVTSFADGTGGRRARQCD